MTDSLFLAELDMRWSIMIIQKKVAFPKALNGLNRGRLKEGGLKGHSAREMAVDDMNDVIAVEFISKNQVE